MRNGIFFLLLAGFSLGAGSCIPRGIEKILDAYADSPPKKSEENISFEEATRRLDLYWAIIIRDVEAVEKYMNEGYDPNKSRGEEGWAVSTPLGILAYYTYMAESPEEKNTPDVAMFKSLVDAGADVNKFPYVWCVVYDHGDREGMEFFLRYPVLRRTGNYPQTEEEFEELERQQEEGALCYIRADNRIIEAFLEAGADPDKLGHPYPYSLEAKRRGITDEEAEEYFVRGTRPINEAIKKGMWWESQVDLLLRYTTLDEDSLEAARESKDPAMIEKITKLWNEQAEGR